ncbi:uncharacterized protein BT62DRAFT_1009676 [Guyanagaster necrorhizus]|uniref:Uncharacterized protein n=1 Tax=Guyanagaster necrorhizus TaxID=856835 RepID=A0A9P8APS2_9AGAR|nr:uncharacterized protein BT62DRAFT_1009676 [Guyanagaster necrorhizus MCA 3950]KAG7443076.1 hypothetical protein BT62DRAFT_1009676 [Guyanagaster necrorhizus MCA 3950]
MSMACLLGVLTRTCRGCYLPMGLLPVFQKGRRSKARLTRTVHMPDLKYASRQTRNKVLTIPCLGSFLNIFYCKSPSADPDAISSLVRFITGSLMEFGEHRTLENWSYIHFLFFFTFTVLSIPSVKCRGIAAPPILLA